MHNKLTSHELCNGAHSAATAAWPRHQRLCHPWPELQLDLSQSKRQQSLLIKSCTRLSWVSSTWPAPWWWTWHVPWSARQRWQIPYYGRGAVEDLLHQGMHGLHIAAVCEFELTRLLSQMLSASGSLYRSLRSHTRWTHGQQCLPSRPHQRTSWNSTSEPIWIQVQAQRPRITIESPGVHLATQAKAHLRESQHNNAQLSKAPFAISIGTL